MLSPLVVVLQNITGMNPKASCGTLNPPLRGIVQLTNSAALRFRNWSFNNKIDFGPGYRIYFGKDGNKLIILLCGGNKKTQMKDIEKAKKYWQDYKDRKKQEV